jgi:hypothetical protein
VTWPGFWDERYAAHPDAYGGDPNAGEALRPGGVVLIEAFTPAQLGRDSGGPKDPALLYTPELLAGDFPGASFEILAHASVDLDEGPFHQGAAEVVRLAARKPAGRP